MTIIVYLEKQQQQQPETDGATIYFMYKCDACVAVFSFF